MNTNDTTQGPVDAAPAPTLEAMLVQFEKAVRAHELGSCSGDKYELTRDYEYARHVLLWTMRHRDVDSRTLHEMLRKGVL